MKASQQIISHYFRIFYPHKRTVLVSKHIKFDEENLTTTLGNTFTEETVQLKFRANSNDMQDLDKQEAAARVVQDEKESAADQEKFPVSDPHRVPTTSRPNLRSRSSTKPPPRLEVNVEHIPKIFKEAMSGPDDNKASGYN